MAALDINSQIPSNLNSVERMVLWTLLLYKKLVGNKTYEEVQGAGATVRFCETFYQTVGDGRTFVVVRVAVPLAEDYATDTTVKLWMKAEDVVDTTLPVAYTTN